MMKRLLSLSLVLLCSVVTAWAESKTITVKDQPTVNGSTVAYADGSKTVAYTSADNAIWYLCDVDMAMLKSIEVKGAAFASKGDGTKAQLKIAFMPNNDETVDADYLSTNSSTIRSANRLVATIEAETVPTTMASGKNATNYPGANFLINSEVTLQDGYDGTVNEGTHKGITKTTEKVHLFVYGTASSRRLAIDQIVVNTNTPVYNKTTDTYYADLNTAFAALTDADTELEVSDDIKLTARLTWNKAKTLTITPTADITITASKTDHMWFLTNNTGKLSVGSSSHKITLDGQGKTYSADITKREKASPLYLTNVEFKNFDLGSTKHLATTNESGSNIGNSQIFLEDVAITDCSNPKDGYVGNYSTSNDNVYLNKSFKISGSDGAAIYTLSRIRLGEVGGSAYVNLTTTNTIKINWGGTFAAGTTVVIRTTAASAAVFELTNEEWALERQSNNGDLKMAVPAAPTVKIGEKGYADLAAALAAVVEGGEATIELLEDQELTARMNIQNKTITITGDGKSIKRASSNTGNMLFLTQQATGEYVSSLTLDGITIDGQNVATTVAVIEASNSGTTTLKNVTIQNVNTTANGAIINKSNGYLVLDGVTFTNCTAGKAPVFVGTDRVTLKGENTIGSIYIEKALVLKADNATATAPIQLITEADKRTWGMLIEGGDATQFTNADFRLSQQQNGVYAMPKAEAANYSHPALLHTSADITAIKGRLNEGLTKTAYDHLKNAGVGASYTASPVIYLKRMDKNNWESTYSDFDNYTQAANDAKAAYQLALRYQLGGEENCATAAVKILNDWATTNKGFLRVTRKTDGEGYANAIPDPNEYLICIQAYQFANAAELLRDYTGWAAADQTNFKNWIRQTFADVAILFLENHHNNANALHYWLNWDLAALNAMLSVGVLCNDKALVDYALNYVDNGQGTGNKQNAIVATHNDTDSDETLAQCQESGRDQGHATLDISLLGVLCQTAKNIGTDLFTPYKALEMAEYVGKYNLKADEESYKYNNVPFTQYTNNEVTHSVISADARGTERNCWELFMAYAKANDKAAAYTTEWVQYLRNKYAWGEGEATTNDELGFGTLMFATPNDIPSGISTVESSKLKVESYYDLSGRRVAQPTKGLYIVNGKKVVVK